MLRSGIGRVRHPSSQTIPLPELDHTLAQSRMDQGHHSEDTATGLPSVQMQYVQLHIAAAIPEMESPSIQHEIQRVISSEAAQSRCSLAQTPAVIKARDEFILAVNSFNSSSQGQKLGCDPSDQLGSAGSRDWPQIVDALEKSEQAYLRKNDSSRGARMRTWLRSFSRLEGTINSWIRLLPSESWQGSVLAGGLKIILTAAVRLQSMREQIGRAIGQMADSIGVAERLHRLYSTVIESHAISVVVGCLEVMQACIAFFARSSAKRAFGAVTRGNDYDKALSEKIEALKESERQMDRQAVVISQEEQRRARDVGAESQRQDAQNFLGLVRRLLTDVELRKDVDFKNNLRLQEILESQLLAQAQQQKWREQAEALEKVWTISLRNQILGYLNFNPMASENDLVTCLQAGHQLGYETESRAVYIIEQPEVIDWMSSPASATLVINAEEEAHLLSHSTASFFTTNFVFALKQSGKGVVLHWFCGQHDREDPAAILISLLGQLLETALDHATSSDLGIPLADISPTLNNLKCLFINFLQLQLRKTPVYILLDSVSVYEDYKRVTDLLFVWTEIDNLGRSEDPDQMPLKLLATSPSQCIRIGTKHDPTNPATLSLLRGPTPGRLRAFDR
ncbi:hypothetical protein LTR95_009327 [Oleoguttula sp. CCFEE 5521]